MPEVFVAKEEKPKTKKNPKREIREEPEKPVDSLGFFTSYQENPALVSFQTQEQDERIILFLRRHFITNLPWLLTTAVLILLPIFFAGFLSQLTESLLLPERFLFILLVFYYLIVFAYAFINFITWFYAISLITEKEIVDVDFSDIIYHNVATTKLNLIEDVDYTQTGILQSFFDFGDVYVQTAGNKPNFDFLGIPKPKAVASIVHNLIGQTNYA